MGDQPATKADMDAMVERMTAAMTTAIGTLTEQMTAFMTAYRPFHNTSVVSHPPSPPLAVPLPSVQEMHLS
jgi:hypothetical protein